MNSHASTSPNSSRSARSSTWTLVTSAVLSWQLGCSSCSLLLLLSPKKMCSFGNGYGHGHGHGYRQEHVITFANHTSNFSFFLHGQNFWKIKFTRNLHSKLPIFCVKSVKIYTGQKKFTQVFPWLPRQIRGMLTSSKTNLVRDSEDEI